MCLTCLEKESKREIEYMIEINGLEKMKMITLLHFYSKKIVQNEGNSESIDEYILQRDLCLIRYGSLEKEESYLKACLSNFSSHISSFSSYRLSPLSSISRSSSPLTIKSTINTTEPENL